MFSNRNIDGSLELLLELDVGAVECGGRAHLEPKESRRLSYGDKDSPNCIPHGCFVRRI